MRLTQCSALLLASTVLLGLGCSSGGGAGGPAGGSSPAANEAQLADVCASLVSCPDQWGDSFLKCVSDLELSGASPSRLAFANDALLCVQRAGADCAEVGRCMGETKVPNPSCTQHCEGSVTIDCNGGAGSELVESRLDCAVWGETCVMSTQGKAECATRACTESSTTCDGNVVVECYDGVETREECKAGTTCDTNGVSTFDSPCKPTGPACTADRCDGNVAVDCNNGVEGARRNCSLVAGHQCLLEQDLSELYAHCDLLQSVIDQCQNVEPTCTNGVISDCFVSGPRTYDCKAHGWAGCGLHFDDPTDPEDHGNMVCTPAE
jgi:hypothetical protein